MPGVGCCVGKYTNCTWTVWFYKMMIFIYLGWLRRPSSTSLPGQKKHNISMRLDFKAEGLDSTLGICRPRLHTTIAIANTFLAVKKKKILMTFIAMGFLPTQLWLLVCHLIAHSSTQRAVPVYIQLILWCLSSVYLVDSATRIRVLSAYIWGVFTISLLLFARDHVCNFRLILGHVRWHEVV